MVLRSIDCTTHGETATHDFVHIEELALLYEGGIYRALVAIFTLNST